MLSRNRRLVGVALGLLLAALAVTPVRAKDYSQKFREAIEAAKKGDAAGAIKLFEKDAGKDRDKDKLLCLYEMGALYQIMGNWDKSAETFEKARSLADEYDMRARASASGTGHQIGAVLTNDRALIYYGSDYERVMCHTLNAVNYLLKNDVEGATVEIRKADEYQKKCEERARLATEKEPVQQDEAQAEQVVQSSPGLSGAFAPMDKFTAGIRNSYQNAFTYYLSGIVYEAQGDRQGYNDAAIDLKKAYDLAPDAPAIRTAYLYNMKRFDPAEYQALSGRMDETLPDLPATEFGTLVVLYEAGLVPEKQEIKIDLPIKNNLLSFAFPIYSNLETNQHELWVRAGGQSVATARVVDMRPLAVKALNEQRKGIVVRAVARAITKAAATNEAGKRFGLLAQLGVEIFTFATNRADTRSWSSLPAEVRAARLYLPPGDTEVEIPILSGKVAVTIQPGAITLLMVRGIEGVAHAKQVTLKKKSGALAVPAVFAANDVIPQQPGLAPESSASRPSPYYAEFGPGMYLRQGTSGDFLELCPDGTSFLFKDGHSAIGNFKVDGDALIGAFPQTGGKQTNARIVGATLSGEDGNVWEKQAVPERTAQPSVPSTPPLKEAAPAPVAGQAPAASDKVSLQGQSGSGLPPRDYTASVVGKYFRKNRSDYGKNSDDYLEFRPDGTVFMKVGEKTYSGTYKVQGDTVTTRASLFRGDSFRISGDTIVGVKGGSAWEKQVEPPATRG